ncbi:MAG: nitrite reductase small subunit NirD [Ilumatobacteraceae bacterium]
MTIDRSAAPVDSTAWTIVARPDELRVDRGVAALVGGESVAVFRLADGTMAAIDHVEPFTNVPVLARGLVGSTGAVTYVSSPLHKQRFDLATGRCLDDDAFSVRVWTVQVIDGYVCIAPQAGAFVPGTNSPGRDVSATYPWSKPARNETPRDLAG